jgi:8-oxo-dGTP pyrophosphatase MutT (NUDIX family)
MFKYCPDCASPKITFRDNKLFRCPDCGFVYYHNIAAATGCVIRIPDADANTAGGGERLVFLVRGKEPAAGKLDLPGGFVDLQEGALEGLYRELKEEIGWAPPVPMNLDVNQLNISLAGIFTLFASFPNAYPYKGIMYNTCDMFFHVSAPGLNEQDLRLEKAEVAGVRFLRPNEINFDDFAFDSTKRAVKAYLAAQNL